MKTLDEVIDAFEWCMHDDDADCSQCPYYTGKDTDCHDRNVDTLYYLKKLKRVEEKIEKIAIGNVEDTLSKIDNPALTWEDLKQMEGKPVWIEAESISIGVSPYWKDWYIIKSFSDDDFMYCNDGYEWAKETQGRMWQAYKKERNENNR